MLGIQGMSSAGGDRVCTVLWQDFPSQATQYHAREGWGGAGCRAARRWTLQVMWMQAQTGRMQRWYVQERRALAARLTAGGSRAG